MLIYVLFEPLKVKEQQFVDVPLLKIDNFVMYELDKTGLQTLMSGTKALRYSNRYIVNDIDFTDNSQLHISNMLAKKGIYKNDIVDLVGDVVYTRDDGLIFKSPTLTYNTKSSIAQTQSKFVAHKGKNSMNGSSFVYDSLKETMKSKNVAVKYQLKESNI